MLPDSIPYAANADDDLAEPLQLLARARASYGNLFAIRKEGPMFSRAPECAGVIAAFGVNNQRAVLTDIESFGLPISAAENMKLPQNLVTLNRSLHSMRGTEHATQKRHLMGMLNRVEPSHRSIWATLEEIIPNWTAEPVELVKRMRELTFAVSLRVLFGDGQANTRQLASLLQAYFYLRREAASSAHTANREELEQLAMVGNLVDSELREFIRACRQASPASPGVFANLAMESGEARLSEDEAVGHMNIFFISTTEPVAVALSWVLLVLSQLPELRIELRNELDATLQANTCPTEAQLNKLTLLDCVINETLRLLPPNALMVRITTKPILLSGVTLPARCEILLCPFISHRDGAAFHHAEEFLPSRWQGTPPSPFLYFPFGAGGHACIGRGIAIDMMKTTLAFLLPRFDLLLAESQDVDWSIRIMLLPTPDPSVIFHPLHSQTLPKSGKITGPIAALVNLQSTYTAS
jgi:cytochrome P450